MRQAPMVFISYTHDSVEHRNWVHRLAADLRADGVATVFDMWNTLGLNLAEFMRARLDASSKVLCVLSERYAGQAGSVQTDSEGAAARRGDFMLNAELCREAADLARIIILFRANPLRRTPAFLQDASGLDFGLDFNEENTRRGPGYTLLLQKILLK